MTVMLHGLARDPDGDKSARDGSAADDTTYNFFPYNECHPILVCESSP